MQSKIMSGRGGRRACQNCSAEFLHIQIILVSINLDHIRTSFSLNWSEGLINAMVADVENLFLTLFMFYA